VLAALLKVADDRSLFQPFSNLNHSPILGSKYQMSLFADDVVLVIRGRVLLLAPCLYAQLDMVDWVAAFLTYLMTHCGLNGCGFVEL
jgi:hypothetical protein